ncbi:MAG: SMP-30/gluconolactonase/LRE family protein, partial [Verrucomicrobia bacterium]|nr:SMP-30/gluconolactonase/LRE family protein [Verrucomicrobiota bacterium]
PIDWLWRKGALQCAIEWEKNRSFVAFAGNPYLMTVRENGALDVKEYPCFKNGIYSTFELAISYDRKVYYSNTHWGEPPLHAGRLYRLDPESGENELVGQFRCGKLTDFRHISGGAISRDGRTLYYFALVPKELRDRPDLTFERLNIENSQFARGKHTTYWPREYFKPVLVICRLAN